MFYWEICCHVVVTDMYLLPIVPDHVPGMDGTASKLYLLKLYMDMVAKKGKKRKEMMTDYLIQNVNVSLQGVRSSSIIIVTAIVVT